MELPTLPQLPSTILEHISKHNSAVDGQDQLYKFQFQRSNFPEEIVKFFGFEQEKSHPMCNWLIPKKVLMSSYPGDQNESVARAKLSALLSSGINCFVCLQETSELAKFVPYKNLVLEEAKKLGMNEEAISFVHFPIIDNYIVEEKLMDEFTDQLIYSHLKDKKQTLLIHCWGGHGRTGTVATILLGKLYPHLSIPEALLYAQVAHDSRLNPRSGSCPETDPQRRQIVSILKKYKSK